MFRSLKNGEFIAVKEFKCFSFYHKTTFNLGQFYFLPKIRKILFNVPAKPVVSNY